MTASNDGWDKNELSSSACLLKWLENDMQAVHTQMEVLKIVFDNLKGSWLAISLAHQAFRIHREEGIAGSLKRWRKNRVYFVYSSTIY